MLFFAVFSAFILAGAGLLVCAGLVRPRFVCAALSLAGAALISLSCLALFLKTESALSSSRKMLSRMQAERELKRVAARAAERPPEP